MLQNKKKNVIKTGLQRKKNKESFLHELKKNKILFLMLIPAVIYVIIFSYIPLMGLTVAFKQYNYIDGILSSPWNGLENFKYFFASGKALLITKNTVTFNLVFIITETFLEVLCAILLVEISGKYFKKICQSFMFLPFFMSWVIIATIAYNVFNYEYGILNSIINSFGGDSIDVYNLPGAWKILLPMFSAWKNVGYGSIVYLAAIMGISSEEYEAALIDGAGILQKIYYITLPHLKPTVIIMVLLATGRILRGNFDMFYQLVGTSANLYDSTDIIETFVFRSMISGSDFGMISAASFYQSILCFVIIVSVNKVVKMFEKDYALF